VIILDGRPRGLLLALLLPTLALAEAPSDRPAAAAPTAGAAETATAPAATSTATPPPAPCPPQNPPPTPGVDVVLGAGYFEALHVGAAWHVNPNHTLGLFAGTNFGVPPANVNTLGLDWRYRLDRDLGGLAPSLLLRALYWTQQDEFYHWKLLSAEVGGSLTREIAPGTSVSLDAAAVRTFVLESDRLQDSSFGSPSKWNATLCLSISHRLASW
jgi:hypothetical protein